MRQTVATAHVGVTSIDLSSTVVSPAMFLSLLFICMDKYND